MEQLTVEKRLIKRDALQDYFNANMKIYDRFIIVTDTKFCDNASCNEFRKPVYDQSNRCKNCGTLLEDVFKYLSLWTFKSKITDDTLTGEMLNLNYKYVTLDISTIAYISLINDVGRIYRQLFLI